jgi:hypothetical protein
MRVIYTGKDHGMNFDRIEICKLTDDEFRELRERYSILIEREPWEYKIIYLTEDELKGLHEALHQAIQTEGE